MTNQNPSDTEPLGDDDGGYEGPDIETQTESAPIHGPDEPSIPELELDETIAPRPEEEIADLLRAEPDVEDH